MVMMTEGIAVLNDFPIGRRTLMEPSGWEEIFRWFPLCVSV